MSRKKKTKNLICQNKNEKKTDAPPPIKKKKKKTFAHSKNNRVNRVHRLGKTRCHCQNNRSAQISRQHAIPNETL